jgi:hypothetical protein
MMKNITFLFLFAFLLFQACNNDHRIFNNVPTCENCNFTCVESIDTNTFTNDCRNNWDCSFIVIDESKVDIDESPGYANGNKNVFLMSSYTEGNPAIADDEFTYNLVFELDDSQNSFSVENEDLKNMNVHFQRSCFCSFRDFMPLTSGCLQGEKQADGTWFIQGNLIATYDWGDIEVKIDAQFVQ